jgi:hypothetical protein
MSQGFFGFIILLTSRGFFGFVTGLWLSEQKPLLPRAKPSFAMSEA